MRRGEGSVGAGGGAEFGRGGAWVVTAFGGGGADRFGGDLGIDAVLQALFEGEFDAAVFAGVEGEEGDASARFETVGERAEEFAECAEFIVDGDAEGLEDSLDRTVGIFLGGTSLAIEGGTNELGEGLSGCEGLAFVIAEDGFGEEFGVGFVGVFGEE